MREALAPLVGQRIVVRAAFRRFDVAPLDWGGHGRSRGILLVGVTTPAGDLLADHLWLAPSRTLIRLKLQGGEAVELRGMVVRYRRADGSEDFKIADVRSALAGHPGARGGGPADGAAGAGLGLGIGGDAGGGSADPRAAGHLPGRGPVPGTGTPRCWRRGARCGNSSRRWARCSR